MDWIKIFGGQAALVLIVPGIVTQIGMSLKNKDDNTTGYDDAGGNVLLAVAPVIPAFLTGNDTLINKSLDALLDVVAAYRGHTVTKKKQ